MKTEILTLLRETDGYVSGQELCEKFGVSRTAVWKAINQLKEAGYEIEAVQNKGYRLVSVPDILSESELQSVRKTRWIGEKIAFFDVVDSTNTRAKQLAEEGAPNGTYVIAERQDAGKGRRGRGFDSPAGQGIWMTLVLKPEIDPNHASMITLVTALAVSKAITDMTGRSVGIKWPNDIIMSGKKVCGILTEMSAQFDYVNHIVVGIGINVQNKSFPKDIESVATSLFIETKEHYHRAELVERIWEAFEHYYEIFLQTEDLSGLVNEYNSHLVNMHQQVKVLDPKEPFEGKAMGITPKGELIVDTWEGRKLVSSENRRGSCKRYGSSYRREGKLYGAGDTGIYEIWPGGRIMGCHDGRRSKRSFRRDKKCIWCQSRIRSL